MDDENEWRNKFEYSGNSDWAEEKGSQPSNRKRHSLLGISAVLVLGLVIGGYFLWEKKSQILTKINSLLTPSEQNFLDLSALKELDLRVTAQRRLSNPRVAAVFYIKDYTTKAEPVIQSVDVTDLNRAYRSADQLRGALNQEPLNEHERKQMAETVLNNTILDFGAESSPGIDRSSINAETDRRIERIAAAAQNDHNFKPWVTANYGSRAELRNKVERGIVRQEYLARKGLSKQEAVQALKRDLEIMWADKEK